MILPFHSSRKRRKAVDLALGLGITAGVVFLFFLRWGPIEAAHYKLFDLALHFRGDVQAPSEVVILAIDDAAAASLGRWPWPRSKVAELIARLSQAGARIIAVDAIFLPADAEQASGNDRILGQAAQRAGNVLLPFYFTLGKSKEEKKGGEIPAPVLFSAFLLFDDPKKFMDFPPLAAEEIFISTPEIIRGPGPWAILTSFPTRTAKCAGTR